MLYRIPVLFFLILFLGINDSDAQKELDILLLNDSKKDGQYLMGNEIKNEISALMSSTYPLNFIDYFMSENIISPEKIYEEIYITEQADVVISTGMMSSQILNKFKDYPSPTIASVNIESSYKEVGDTSRAKKSNYTYVESPFDIRKDLETMIEITKPKEIVILMEERMNGITSNIETILSGWFDVEFKRINIENDPQSTLQKIEDGVDAAYLLSPFPRYTKEESISFFEGISDRKIPCFTLFDDPMIAYGAYASFSSTENMERIPRKIAIQVSKIAEGVKPEDLDVSIQAFTEELYINMKSVNKTGIYPSWEVLDYATLVNINEIDADRKINLKSAIAEGLENNLGLQSEKMESQIVKKDIGIARSNFLPQLEVESTGLWLDENSVNSSFGTKGSFNWSAGASFSQLILSEPAMANVAIQKLLYESQTQKENQVEMDIILDVASAYLICLQAESLNHLHNENSAVKKKNLEIAQNKEKVGYSAVNDVYRWESELALSKVDFQNSSVQLKASKYRLNLLLNRPVDEDFQLTGIDMDRMEEGLFNGGMNEWIGSPGEVEAFSEFMYEEAKKNLPELRQMEAAVAMQQRMFKSSKIAYFTPTIAFGASYDHPLAVVNPGEPISIPGIEFGSSSSPSWNAAVVASIPVFTGTYRKKQKQKSHLLLQKTELIQSDVQSKLELQVRASVESTISSFNQLKLTQKAAESAQKNLVIVQDLYETGQINVSILIDAQNAALGASINASNTVYNFMIDLFELQRSSGVYQIFNSEEERKNFLTRYINFKTSVNK